MSRPVAIVTGASAGIGLEIVHRLAKQGYHLVLCARRIERLEALAAELKRSGILAIPVQCDVRSDADVERAAALARENFGRIDLVIANAGFNVPGSVERLTVTDLQEQFDTNVYGVHRIIRATLPDLRATRGRIGIIGSAMSYISIPGTAAYSMSKAAVRAYADALRMEVKQDGISVTLLCPGFIATEFRLVDRQGELKAGRRDPIPAFLTMSAPRAARQIVRAVQRRKAEVPITLHARIGMWLQRQFPAIMRWLGARLARPAQKMALEVSP